MGLLDKFGAFTNSVKYYAGKCLEKMGGRDAAIKKMDEVSRAISDFTREKAEAAKTIIVNSQTPKEKANDEKNETRKTNDEIGM